MKHVIVISALILVSCGPKSATVHQQIVDFKRCVEDQNIESLEYEENRETEFDRHVERYRQRYSGEAQKQIIDHCYHLVKDRKYQNNEYLYAATITIVAGTIASFVHAQNMYNDYEKRPSNKQFNRARNLKTMGYVGLGISVPLCGLSLYKLRK